MFSVAETWPMPVKLVLHHKYRMIAKPVGFRRNVNHR